MIELQLDDISLLLYLITACLFVLVVFVVPYFVKEIVNKLTFISEQLTTFLESQEEDFDDTIQELKKLKKHIKQKENDDQKIM